MPDVGDGYSATILTHDNPKVGLFLKPAASLWICFEFIISRSYVPWRLFGQIATTKNKNRTIKITGGCSLQLSTTALKLTVQVCSSF